MDKKDEKALGKVYEEVFKHALELNDAGYESQQVAATYMAIGIRNYKTCLDDEGFKSMMETIMDSTDTVKPYNIPKLH